MELLFEKFGAAIGVAQVFGGVALRGYLKSDGATLERCAQIRDALAVGVIECFRNAKNGSQTASDALIVVVQ